MQAWFCAFAYLSFFWIELLTSCKRGITKIVAYKVSGDVTDDVTDDAITF